MDDDLTASHWDDMLPPLQSQFAALNFQDFSSGFGNMQLHDPHKGSDDEDGSGEENDQENDQTKDSTTYVLPAATDTFRSASVFNQSELDQLSELQKEERKEKTTNLLSELTNGAEEVELEASFASPTKMNPIDSLFSDRGTPLKVQADLVSDLVVSPTKSPKLKNGKFKATRARRYPSKTVVKHLKEESTSSVDPLGPLGGDLTADSKEESTVTKKAESIVQEANAPLYKIESDDTETKTPSSAESKIAVKLVPATSTDDSNDLEISVGDPVKVGDITNAHIVYSLRTKNKNTKSEYFPVLGEYVTVSRRYKDFRWIYHQLQNNHPGRIIPPPPTKQTYIGRFNESFIENRRLSLEKMLTKISKIPSFANDQDFVMFLTSDDFANESKERERISGSGASAHPDYQDDDSSSSSSAAVVAGTTATGFMSSLFSISTKLPEPDSYFSKKKAYIEDLEHNLKTFYKSLELIATQRVEIIGVSDEIAATLDALADLEISKVTSELLGAFAEVHLKLRENLDRVNLLDQLTLGFTIEEYLRIIGSVKHIFETRLNIYQQYTTFKSDLTKKQESLDRLNSKYKTSVDKISMLNFEVDKLKQKVAHYEKSFTSISETIKEEIDNFEIDKIQDFRNSVEIFIESSIESQKEAIELWETFYDRQKLAQV